MTGPRRTRRRASGGFTIIEVLIAMAIMAIGLVGVVGIQRTSMQASGYSRHATEAAVLGEDKLEQLRTTPISLVADGSEVVNGSGVVDSTGLFTRTWALVWTSDLATLTVTVSWGENDGAHTVTFRTVRSQ